MQDKIKKQILDAFFITLRPVAKILLRYGIGFREFAEVTKSAFVDVATSEYGIRGRPTNISRVAVMTGLTRKEVRRLRDKLEAHDHSTVTRGTPMGDVLHHWYADDEFLDDSGSPASLPFQGESQSFTSLVKRFGGDIPPGAMRAELVRVGAVTEGDEGLLTAVTRNFISNLDYQSLINSLVHSGYSLMTTFAHNTNPDVSERPWAERVIYSQKVGKQDLAKLRRVSADRINEFTNAMDDTFMAYETISDVDEHAGDHELSTVSVGVFYFEEQNSDLKHNW